MTTLTLVTVLPERLVAQHEIENEKFHRYADAMKLGQKFPRFVAVQLPDNAVMPIDGHHRLAAAQATDTPISGWMMSCEDFDNLCIRHANPDRMIRQMVREMDEPPLFQDHYSIMGMIERGEDPMKMPG